MKNDGGPRPGGSVKLRVAIGVTLLWTLVAIVSGTQSVLEGSMSGTPVPFGPALRQALINFLPWIPGTLAVVWLVSRFPLERGSWTRTVWLHLIAIPLVTLGVNALIVLEFWATSGSFAGPVELLRQAARWATVNFHVGVMLYLAIGAATLAVRYYLRTRARELNVARLEGQLAKARLQALNAQIRPHFLFNTLHTIGQMWRSGRSDEADRLLDHLGSLFQRVQSTASEAEVPLREELDLVREYLAIEQVRFRDRLTTEVRATPEALRCAVPPLLLQPLVENAVRHGISTTSTAGRVSVDARIEDASLRIDVADDGPGLRPNGSSRGTGTGLSNTRERLAELYGDDASLDVSSGSNGGVLARVVLPAVGRARA